jgi:hypothetical protein
MSYPIQGTAPSPKELKPLEEIHGRLGRVSERMAAVCARSHALADRLAGSQPNAPGDTNTAQLKSVRSPGMIGDLHEMSSQLEAWMESIDDAVRRFERVI